MIMNLKTSIQNVWIFKSEDEAKLALDYIQEAVDEWIGTNRDKPFAVRDLFGGESAWDWQNMPLEPLWKNYREKGKTPEEAFDLAAKAAGKLLKKFYMKIRENLEYMMVMSIAIHGLLKNKFVVHEEINSRHSRVGGNP